MTEFDQNQQNLREFLASRQLEALLLLRASSFAWATCGAASYINTASSEGAASLLVTPTGRYILATNIEAPRLEKEEKLAAQGWEIRPEAWHAAPQEFARLTHGLRVGADEAFPGATDRQRSETPGH